MLRISVDDHEVLARLGQLIRRGKNPSPVLQGIGEALAESTQQRFQTSTGPEGRRWAGNSDSVLRRILHSTKGNFTKKGGLSAKGSRRLAGKKPLVDTGVLADTIHYQVAGSSVSIGTNRFAGEMENGAAVHQFGGLAGRGRNVKIPARPFLGFSASDRSTTLDLLARFLAP